MLNSHDKNMDDAKKDSTCVRHILRFAASKTGILHPSGKSDALNMGQAQLHLTRQMLRRYIGPPMKTRGERDQNVDLVGPYLDSPPPAPLSSLRFNPGTYISGEIIEWTEE